MSYDVLNLFGYDFFYIFYIVASMSTILSRKDRDREQIKLWRLLHCSKEERNSSRIHYIYLRNKRY